MAQHMISTDDNPWNPFKNFDEWYAYDIANGHHSLSLLARLAMPDDSMTPEEQSQEIERTIDEIADKIVSEHNGKVVHYIKMTQE